MNDLISRKALLAEYDREHIGEPGNARKLIEDAPAAQEWISVKDRLPEETEFIYEDRFEPSSYGSYFKSDLVLVYTRIGLIGTGRTCDQQWDTYCEDDEVTHWMPLPQTPKGE